MENLSSLCKHFSSRPSTALVAAAYLFFAVSAPAPAPAQDVPAAVSPTMTFHLNGILVYPDGKPGAGATVTFRVVEVHKTGGVTVSIPVSTQSITADDQGTFSTDVSLERGKSEGIVAYAAAPGYIALFSSYDPSAYPIVLEPLASVKIRLVGDDGKPISSITVSPKYFVVSHGSSGQCESWYSAGDDRWNATSDGSGLVTLSGLPQNCPIVLDLHESKYLNPTDQISVTTASPSTVQTVKLNLAASISGVVTYGSTNQPAANVNVSAEGDSTGPTHQGFAHTDGQGKYQIYQLPPGEYGVEYDGPGRLADPAGFSHLSAIAVQEVLKPGDNLTGIDLALINGSILTGTVTNKYTGKPDPGIMIQSNGPDHPSNFSVGVEAITDSDGKYSVCVAPGEHSVVASTQYGGAIPPEDNVSGLTLASGEMKTLDFVVPDPGSPSSVSGVVYLPNGTPAEGAKVGVIGNADFDTSQEITDKDGAFTLDQPGVFASAKVYASLGALMSPAVQAANPAQKLFLHLAPKIGAAITGFVKDTKGEPLGGVTVSAYQQQGGADSAVTNSLGYFSFPAEYPGSEYTLSVIRPGYSERLSPFLTTVKAVAGRSVRAPTLVMTKDDSFFGGKVVDRTGAPVADAVVSTFQVDGLSTQTDARGRFLLKGVPEQQVYLHVQAPLGRQGSIQELSGATNYVITVMNQSEEDAAEKQFEAMVDADPSNHGDGADAIVLLKAAEAKAITGRKSIILVFHSAWCSPCYTLQRFLETKSVKRVLDKHFVVLSIDIWESGKTKPWENPHGTDLYAKFGGRTFSVPFTVLLSPTGKKISDSDFDDQNIGVPSGSEEIDFFTGELKAAQPALTAADLNTLRQGIQQVQTVFN